MYDDMTNDLLLILLLFPSKMGINYRNSLDNLPLLECGILVFNTNSVLILFSNDEVSRFLSKRQTLVVVKPGRKVWTKCNWMINPQRFRGTHHCKS